jgi:hypothetical protein
VNFPLIFLAENPGDPETGRDQNDQQGAGEERHSLFHNATHFLPGRSTARPGFALPPLLRTRCRCRGAMLFVIALTKSIEFKLLIFLGNASSCRKVITFCIATSFSSFYHAQPENI